MELRSSEMFVAIVGENRSQLQRSEMFVAIVGEKERSSGGATPTAVMSLLRSSILQVPLVLQTFRSSGAQFCR